MGNEWETLALKCRSAWVGREPIGWSGFFGWWVPWSLALEIRAFRSSNSWILILFVIAGHVTPDRLCLMLRYVYCVSTADINVPDFMSESATPILVTTQLTSLELRPEEFLSRFSEVLEILVSNQGCEFIDVGQSMDSASRFVVTSRWISVGHYRKALSNFEVKAQVVPFLSLHSLERADAEASVTTEVVLRLTISGRIDYQTSLATDAFTFERGNQ